MWNRFCWRWRLPACACFMLSFNLSRVQLCHSSCFLIPPRVLTFPFTYCLAWHSPDYLLRKLLFCILFLSNSSLFMTCCDVLFNVVLVFIIPSSLFWFLQPQRVIMSFCEYTVIDSNSICIMYSTVVTCHFEMHCRSSLEILRIHFVKDCQVSKSGAFS